MKSLPLARPKDNRRETIALLQATSTLPKSPRQAVRSTDLTTVTNGSHNRVGPQHAHGRSEREDVVPLTPKPRFQQFATQHPYRSFANYAYPGDTTPTTITCIPGNNPTTRRIHHTDETNSPQSQ